MAAFVARANSLAQVGTPARVGNVSAGHGYRQMAAP